MTDALASPTSSGSAHDDPSIHPEILPDGVRLIRMPVIEDDRGSLAVFERPNHVPFPVARVFTIFGVPVGGRRGCHANRDLHELLIAIGGSVTVRLRTPDREATVRLEHASQGLYLPPMIWLEMQDFAPDTVLVVLASLPYEYDSHIQSYEEYCRLCRGS